MTLDVVVERQAGGVWRRAADITLDQIELRVGGRVIEIESFENRCAPPGGGEAAPTATAGAATATSAAAGNAAATPGREAEDRSPGPMAPHHYILYFDLEHLTLASRHAALQAALDWAEHVVRATDEVMIVTGGSSLRVVRAMRPASAHLKEDLLKVKTDFRVVEMWVDSEWRRVEEVERSERAGLGGGGGGGSLATVYARIDYLKATTSLREMRDLLAIVATIEGPKSLLVFEDTLRLLPGEEYGPSPHLVDVHEPLQTIVRAANDQGLRVYPVRLGGGERADNALTMLATETGGQYLEGTNRAASIFERLARDLSCFYRVGFRIRPEVVGRDAPLEIRIRGDGGPYRVRARRTFGLPTGAERTEEQVRSALLRPSFARAFPVSLTAAPIFGHARGARVRIEVEVPLAELLGLPSPDQGSESRRVIVEIGGEVVPLRAGASAGPRSPDADLWAEVDTGRKAWSFGRRSEITIPPPTHGRTPPRRVVQVEEIDAPPGRYRVAAVVHDQQAGTVAAAVTDLEIGGTPPLLGDVRLFTDDPEAVIPRSGAGEEGGTAPRAPGPREVTAASPLLPSSLLAVQDGPLPRGAPARLVYGVCRADLGGSRLERRLACGSASSTGRLPPPAIVRTAKSSPCVVVVDTLPEERLAPGPCRFEVAVQGREGGRESRSLAFLVSP